jgi:hypothetical protein
MNYLKHYILLMRKAEKRGWTKKEQNAKGLYVERHHIFPVSLYGKNKRIVVLTAREHYVAHTLLEKAFVKRYGLHHNKTKKMTWAHIHMKYGVNSLRSCSYVNSVLYEGVRVRLSQQNLGTKLLKETKEKISVKRLEGNYSGENCSASIPIRVYYEDGEILDYYSGISNFHKEYKVDRKIVRDMINGRREKYKNIIKIEKLEKPKKEHKLTTKSKGKSHPNSFPVRLYFADGKIIEWEDGISNFCSVNTKYIKTALYNLLKGRVSHHRDILKVEKITEDNIEPGPPIIKKYYSKFIIPVRIYFADGRVIDYEKGINNFCSKNPKYNQATLSAVYRGEKNKYKDIVKVERILENEDKEIIPIIKKVRPYRIPIRIYFTDGRVIEEPNGSAEFCRKNPEYKENRINLFRQGIAKSHMDIIKVEEIE